MSLSLSLSMVNSLVRDSHSASSRLISLVNLTSVLFLTETDEAGDELEEAV